MASKPDRHPVLPSVAHKPDESPIYLSAAHLEDPKMPPNSPKIPQRELDLIRRWIEGGLMEGGGIASQSGCHRSAVQSKVVAIAQAPSQSRWIAALPLSH